jgi:hypothetical protein
MDIPGELATLQEPYRQQESAALPDPYQVLELVAAPRRHQQDVQQTAGSEQQGPSAASSPKPASTAWSPVEEPYEFCDAHNFAR